MAKDSKLKIIAEIASSHNGDVGLGKRMIQIAASAGVDIVKFQSWQSRNVDESDPDKARYASLELSDDAHYELKEECEKNGVEFLTTCYNSDRIPFLKELGLEKIKVASTDLKASYFLKKLRDNFKEVIVSTGMSTKEEIEQAVEILKSGEFTMMHCVSVYPCPLEKANMGKLLWLQSLTPHVGYSDHTEGIEAPIFAMGMGVKYIEKHFTLDKHTLQTPHAVGKGIPPITTHSIASEPETFRQICEWRDKYEIALGNGSLELLPEERLTREKYTGRLGRND
ncbi:MAG: N-acetylneuraminate synthase family protein [Candidatus Omnitrophica bacterium]|nr:N-acetylneuraminate synthase family protein [Candidatus Omnitrophota bacterium]